MSRKSEKKETTNLFQALKMYEDKTCAMSEILKVTGVSKATLYKYAKELNK
ncbi:MAG: helix-turn-helix domain-containing protein [Bacteroidales bacterium]|nr:helix-turn-helix domain-containing protein [Candidatus Physcocola equi]